MRIHTNTITPEDVYKAAQIASAGGQGRVYIGKCKVHGSRSQVRAFEVRLEGDGTTSRRRVNPGTSWEHRSGDLPYAATYDQWGWFLAHLYTVDPGMTCWAYKSADDFHAKTDGKYVVAVAV